MTWHKFTWLWLILDQDKDWREARSTIRSTYWGWSQCCKDFILSKNSWNIIWIIAVFKTNHIQLRWARFTCHDFIFFSVWWTFWCSCRNKIKERYYKVIYKSNVIRLILEIFRLNNTQYMCLNVYNICVYPLQITSLIQRSIQSQSPSAKKGRLKARRWRRWRRYIWMKSQSSTSVKKYCIRSMSWYIPSNI